MRINISTVLNAPADDVWLLVKKSSTLLYITKGLLGFRGAKYFPVEWQEGATENTRLLFFGFLPAWKHHLSFQKISNSERSLYTNERGGFVETWNHLIKVEPVNDYTCRYTDDVEIKAGLLTPIVWLYAKILYHYRQRRWCSLLNHESSKY